MKTVIIGTGNVGTQFANIFGTEPVAPRSLEGLPTDADLYIIAVSDSAVAEVVSRLPEVSGIVAHTTGSVPMDVLSVASCKGYGVFYPFQTISKGRALTPDRIPLLIEASDEATLEKMRQAAIEAGFSNVAEADSEMRRRVHLCGTFACNFTNAMIGISQKILGESGLNEEIITPLVEETIAKLHTLPAKKAQTGPAIRKDTPTMQYHQDLLEKLGMTKEAEIYGIISSYIMNN